MSDFDPAALADVMGQLDTEETTWKPETAGEQVGGQVVRIDYTYVAKTGGTMPSIYLRTATGATVRVNAGRTALRSQLDRMKVQPGDYVGVRFLGMVESKSGGNPFYDYRVTHKAVGPRVPGEAFSATRQAEDDGLGLVPGAAESASVFDTPPAF